MTTEKITIKNGKEIRAWIIIIAMVGSLVISGIIGWSNLQGQVKINADNNKKLYGNIKEITREIKQEGTQISQQNQRDIIAMKKDINYTAETVKKIAEKLNIVQ